MPSPPTPPALGFGLQPGGNSSFGVGTPLDLPLPGSGYQPVVDLVAVRQIDPFRKDYVTDSTTIGVPHSSMTAMESAVLIALTQPVGKLPYAPTMGNLVNNLTKQPTPANARSYVEQALAPYTSTKQIAILRVSIEQRGGFLYCVVSWVDLTTKAAPTGGFLSTQFLVTA